MNNPDKYFEDEVWREFGQTAYTLADDQSANAYLAQIRPVIHKAMERYRTDYLEYNSNAQKDIWNEALDYCVQHYFNDVRLLEEIMSKYHIIKKS